MPPRHLYRFGKIPIKKQVCSATAQWLLTEAIKNTFNNVDGGAAAGNQFIDQICHNTIFCPILGQIEPNLRLKKPLHFDAMRGKLELIFVTVIADCFAGKLHILVPKYPRISLITP